MRTPSLVLMAIALAGLSGEATAQYAGQRLPGAPVSGPYRGAPVDDEDFDGPDMVEPPAALPPAVTPRGPGGSQAYDVAPLPPPGLYAEPPRPGLPPGPPRDAYVYPERRPVGPRAYGPDVALEPIRPPADIQGSRAYPGYPPPPGAYAPPPVQAQPPGYAAPPGAYAPPPVQAQPPGYAAPPGYAPPPGAYAPPPVQAPPPGYAPPPGVVPPAAIEGPTGSIGGTGAPASAAAAGNRGYASLPPDYRPEEGKPKELSPHLQRQVVTYPTPEPAGTIIVDTPNTFLYLVLGDGKAMRYGIGVGREGFTWSGVERISKMAEWPDWHPPPEMIERQPYLPRFMAGGESNPLGARALYLGKSIYRIHGTNQPSTIGTFVSSGCIRLTNGDIEDLYRRVNTGTRVVVLAGKPGNAPASPGGQGAAQLPSSSQVIR